MADCTCTSTCGGSGGGCRPHPTTVVLLVLLLVVLLLVVVVLVLCLRLVLRRRLLRLVLHGDNGPVCSPGQQRGRGHRACRAVRMAARRRRGHVLPKSRGHRPGPYGCLRTWVVFDLLVQDGAARQPVLCSRHFGRQVRVPVSAEVRRVRFFRLHKT